MLSRVAENLYWMARYLERAENTARLINSTTQALLDLPKGAAFGWDVLLKVVGLDRVFSAHYAVANEANIMRFLIEDGRNPSALVSCVASARENSRTLREILPKEYWERVNGLYLYMQRHAPTAAEDLSRRYDILTHVIDRCHSLAGLLAGCMSHDLGFLFIELGRNLERADMTTRIVDINSAVLLPRDGGALEPIQERLWMGVLKTLSAYQMYRRHVGVHVQAAAVLRFFLLDAHFPRSVQFCLGKIDEYVGVLPNNHDTLRAVRRSSRRLVGLRWESLTPSVLHEYLDQVQADLGAIHRELSASYFYRDQKATQSQTARAVA